jgi:adenylate cyclase, class 2
MDNVGPFKELEVKYYVHDLAKIERRLLALGALLTQPRTLEVNLRFDTAGNELANSLRVLRLRKDTASRLTYKGPAQSYGGARLRPEIEFVVSDFEAARAFLEALGYQVIVIYEKYRTMYELAGVHVTLDEMPYGHFVELEGQDPLSLQIANRKLRLNWQEQVLGSYTSLFEQLKAEQGYEFRDLTFENFQGIPINSKMLHVAPADLEN